MTIPARRRGIPAALFLLLPLLLAPGVSAQSAGDDPAKAVVAGYFDMLDFCRTEAWGRKSATPTATRERAVALLKGALPGLDPNARELLAKIPAVWTTLQRNWAAASAKERERQRTAWRRSLLAPNPLLPPPARVAKYASSDDTLRFEYPADFMTAQTELDGSDFLFVWRREVQTSWPNALNPATSPTGALFAATEIDEELRQARTLVKGAQLIARKYVIAGSPGMKELAAFDYGAAGFVLLQGTFAGRTEPSFCWVGVLPFGSGRVLICRMIGPLSKAEELLPIFSHMLASAEIRPPDAVASLGTELAAAMIGNSVVSAGWNH